MLERGLSEAIKTDLLFVELELVAERTVLHHLKKPCRVSLLDMMKQHFTWLRIVIASLCSHIGKLLYVPSYAAWGWPPARGKGPATITGSGKTRPVRLV